MATKIETKAVLNEIPCEDPSLRLITFWNPRNKRRQFFLQDKVTGRFVRRVYTIYICITCTFESVNNKRHWSKNIYLESQVQVELDIKSHSLDKIYSIDDLLSIITDIANEHSEECEKCFMLFGVDYEVAGTEIDSCQCEQYCKVARVDSKRNVKKITDYTREAGL